MEAQKEIGIDIAAHPVPDVMFKNQEKAVIAAIDHFVVQGKDRGKIIMPCGSGKTWAAYWILKELKSRRVIITVPNLILQQQAFDTFYPNLRDEYEFICIGSNQDIAETHDDSMVQITTESDEIAAFLELNSNKKIIVIATYQSVDMVCLACKDSDFKFDFAIIDEAHRTVGNSDKTFSKILFDENLHIGKRLFLTATEKIYSGKKDEIIGMNNPKYYGETIFYYHLQEAIKEKIVVDYNVAIMCSTDDDIFEFIRANPYLDYDGIDLEKQEKQNLLCALLATVSAIREQGKRKIVTYHKTIKKAMIFKQLLDGIIGNDMLNMGGFHVNGYQDMKERRKNMDDFQSSSIAVLTNSQALVEGIDIPCVDCIVFADKKESTVQIVQGMGRSLRLYDGKDKSLIIIPILVSSKEDLDLNSPTFIGLRNILMGLSIADRRILQEMAPLQKDATPSENKPKILEQDIKIDNKFRGEILQAIQKIYLKIEDKLTEIWSYNDASKWVCNNLVPLGINSKYDWKEYVNGRIKDVPSLPIYIPCSPFWAYKNNGWGGWRKWFGKRERQNLKLAKYLSYEEAKKWVAKNMPKRINSSKKWLLYIKTNLLPTNIPNNPRKFYKNKGWKNWKDWFGKIERLPYEEAKEWVTKYLLPKGIDTKEKWDLQIDLLPDNIPKHPPSFYKNKGWKGWNAWFGTKRGTVKDINRFLPYNEAIEQMLNTIVPLGINSLSCWKKYTKGKMKGIPKFPHNIPKCPDKVYKNRGWINWHVWFGTEKISYLTYNESRKWVNQNLKEYYYGSNIREWWLKYTSGKIKNAPKLPRNIPKHPNSVYKKIGWVDWYAWVDTEKINYLTYNEARKWMIKNLVTLGINTTRLWKKYLKGEIKGAPNFPRNIPKSPDQYYKNNGWVNWYAWFDKNKKTKQK